MEFNVGDFIYHNKYHRGLLEIIEVHDWYVVVGKNSRVVLSKNMIRHATPEEIKEGKRLWT